MYYRKKTGVRVVAGLMAAVSVCKYQKAERKNKNLFIIKWWRLERGRITVLLGWQTQQSEKGKSRWNGSESTAVREKGRKSVKAGVGEQDGQKISPSSIVSVLVFKSSTQR